MGLWTDPVRQGPYTCIFYHKDCGTIVSIFVLTGFSLQVTSSVNGGNLSSQVNLGRHYSCIGYFGCQIHDVIFVLQMKMVVERSPLIMFHLLSLAHMSPPYRPWTSEVILDN